MVMASGRPSRPGDVRLAHGARVDSVRVLACCTLRTISSAHQGAQGPAEQGERLWLAAEASSSSSSSSSQFDLSLLATRDASSPHRLLPVMRTWRGHQEIQALDDSLGDIDVLLPPFSRLHDQSTARLRVSNALSLTHRWLPPRARRLLASLPARLARLSRLAQLCELPLSHACGHPRACAAAKQALLSTTLPDSGLLPGSLCIPSTPVPHLTKV